MKPPAMVTYLWPSQRRGLAEDLMQAPVVHTGEWQAMNTSTSKHHGTHEMEDITIVVPRVPYPESSLRQLIPADHVWADEHFIERVSGVPHNPPPSHVRWPYAVAGNMAHMSAPVDPSGAMPAVSDRSEYKFDHTYPERFWPKFAGAPDGRGGDMKSNPNRGIRFHYGDLGDVVQLLVRNPMTRQAYLPVWFPEDTGASAHKGDYDPARDGDPSPIRVPCTLGYHFMIRDGRMSMRYYIRSCDAYRHLDNDIYLACRLLQWVCDAVNNQTDWDLVGPPGDIFTGRMVMYISSLHLFEADREKIARKVMIDATA